MADKHAKAEHDLPQGIGRPATNAFLSAGYTRLEHFTAVSEKDILKLHGVGPKAANIIREALAEKGLSFSRDANG